MKLRAAVLAAIVSASAFAQGPRREVTPTITEQQSLTQALNEGASSPLDTIRALEAHLARFPRTTQLTDVQQTLAKAALEVQDWDRLAKYGEPILKLVPDDVILLDRVSFALLGKEDKAAADRAYAYSRTLEDLLDKVHIEPGRDAARQQEDRDRAYARALLYQSRARSITKEPEEAVRLAARAFDAYPSEEAAHEWALTLNRARKPDEAIAKLAEAFAIPDPGATEKGRLNTRIQLGEWYTARHGSEKGLGDLILSAYDRMSTVVETRQKLLLALEPNVAARTAMEFTLTALDGKRFRLDSLKGKVVVMDFWATWCVPCRVQHPLYQTLKERFPKTAGVVFLEINADEERAVVEPFLDEQKWDKEVYFEDGLARLLNVQNIPATILFDKSGQLASRMDGFNPEGFLDSMTTRIQAMLAAK